MKYVESSNNDLLCRWELTRTDTDTDTSNHNSTGMILRAGDTLWQSTIAFWVQDICRDLLTRPEGFTLDMASRLGLAQSPPGRDWKMQDCCLTWLAEQGDSWLSVNQTNHQPETTTLQPPPWLYTLAGTSSVSRGMWGQVTGSGWGSCWGGTPSTSPVSSRTTGLMDRTEHVSLHLLPLTWMILSLKWDN